jgi:uncharacterized protein YdaU (DUF1376 family)
MDEKYTAMTDTEVGFFHRCLNTAWVNIGLPADLDSLARVMRVNRSYLDRIWKVVGECWYQEGDRLFNRTQEEERTHATTKSESATKSVRSRYERRTNDLPRALAQESESESDKTPPKPPKGGDEHADENAPEVPKTETAEDGMLPGIAPSVVRPAVPAKKARGGKRTTAEVEKALCPDRLKWFRELWAAGPWRDGKLEGMDAYERRVRDIELARTIHRSAVRYAAWLAEDPTRKIKFLQGWLSAERWTDECALGDNGKTAAPRAPTYRELIASGELEPPC